MSSHAFSDFVDLSSWFVFSDFADTSSHAMNFTNVLSSNVARITQSAIGSQTS